MPPPLSGEAIRCGGDEGWSRLPLGQRSDAAGVNDLPGAGQSRGVTEQRSGPFMDTGGKAENRKGRGVSPLPFPFAAVQAMVLGSAISPTAPMQALVKWPPETP